MSDKFSSYPFQLKILMATINGLSRKERETVNSALSLAADAHNGQVREGNLPYLIHPIRMANSYANTKDKNHIALSACLLHDVVEDSNISQEEVDYIFGDEIGGIVRLLTRNPSISKDAFYQQILESKNPIAAHIKALDCLDNLLTLEFKKTTEERRKEIADRYINYLRNYANHYYPDKTHKSLLSIGERAHFNLVNRRLKRQLL